MITEFFKCTCNDCHAHRRAAIINISSSIIEDLGYKERGPNKWNTKWNQKSNKHIHTKLAIELYNNFKWPLYTEFYAAQYDWDIDGVKFIIKNANFDLVEEAQSAPIYEPQYQLNKPYDYSILKRRRTPEEYEITRLKEEVKTLNDIIKLKNSDIEKKHQELLKVEKQLETVKTIIR